MYVQTQASCLSSWLMAKVSNNQDDQFSSDSETPDQQWFEMGVGSLRPSKQFPPCNNEMSVHGLTPSLNLLSFSLGMLSMWVPNFSFSTLGQWLTCLWCPPLWAAHVPPQHSLHHTLLTMCPPPNISSHAFTCFLWTANHLYTWSGAPHACNQWLSTQRCDTSCSWYTLSLAQSQRMHKSVCATFYSFVLFIN